MRPFAKYTLNTVLVILFLGLSLALELDPDEVGFWRLAGIILTGLFLVFFTIPEPVEEEE